MSHPATTTPLSPIGPRARDAESAEVLGDIKRSLSAAEGALV